MKPSIIHARNERGSATIVVISVLAVVISLVISNSLVLHHLSKELRLIERQQQEKFHGRPN